MPVTINGNGSISGLAAGGISDAGAIASGALTSLALPAGSVIQVKTAVKTDTSEKNNDTFSNIPSLIVSITPTAATSKFFVICNVTGSSNNQLRLRLARDGSGIGVVSLVETEMELELLFKNQIVVTTGFKQPQCKS